MSCTSSAFNSKFSCSVVGNRRIQIRFRSRSTVVQEESIVYRFRAVQSPETGQTAEDQRAEISTLLNVLLKSHVEHCMRVGLYARVSTKDQSCDMQLRDLRDYCTARQLIITREYIDTAVSGTKDSRPQLNELMGDARKRKLDAILV